MAKAESAKQGAVTPGPPSRASATKRQAAGRRWLVEVLFGLLVIVAGYLYFHQRSMFRAILPHSRAYLTSFFHSAPDVSSGFPSYLLDVAAPRTDPNEYGAGPVVRLAGGRAIAVTTPVLRLTLPPMQEGDAYTVRASLVARLPQPGQVVLLVGGDWAGRASVKGDGTKETLTWRVPAGLLAGQAQSLRFCPDWAMAATLYSPEGRYAVWFYLTDLQVTKSTEAASVPSGQT